MIGVLVMLGAMLAPAAVFAADVTGNVTASNTAPTITSVTLKTDEATPAPTSAITPQTSYLLEIVAGDANTIDDITTIDIEIYHDTTVGAGTSPAVWDADDCAIYKWTKTGGVWSMENGAYTTSWAVTIGNCVTPGTFTGLSGTWKLAFTPGKLAVESTGADTDEWNFKVTVTDAAPASVSDSSEVLNSMAAYSEIGTDVANIIFGAGVALGATAYIDTPVDHNLATQVLANDAYALQSNTAATWTGSGTLTLDPDGTPSAAGQFGLNIDDAGDASGVPTTPQAVTTGAVDITGYDVASTSRVATAASANEVAASQDFYMSLALYSTGIPSGAYSGAITFTVVNS